MEFSRSASIFFGKVDAFIDLPLQVAQLLNIISYNSFSVFHESKSFEKLLSELNSAINEVFVKFAAGSQDINSLTSLLDIVDSSNRFKLNTSTEVVLSYLYNTLKKQTFESFNAVVPVDKYGLFGENSIALTSTQKVDSIESPRHDRSSDDISSAKLIDNVNKQKRDPKLRLLDKVEQIVEELGLGNQKKPNSKLKLSELPSQKDNKSTFQLLCPIVKCTKVYVISVYPRRILYHSLQNHIATVHLPPAEPKVKRLEDVDKSTARKNWELCRCCLKHESDVLLIDSHVKSLFSELIQSHHQLEEGFICAACFENLQRFGSFKQKILKKHEKLLSYSSVTSDVKEEPRDAQMIVFADNVDIAAEIKVEPTIYDWQLDKKMFSVGSEAASSSSEPDSNSQNEPSIDNRKSKTKARRKDVGSAERFSCDHCDLTFTKKARLVQHKASHKIAKDELGRRIKYPCDQCELTFLLKSRLALHKNKMHSNAILCNHCKSEFSTIELMRQHSRFAHRVTGGRTTYKKRNYEYELCTVCGKQVRHDLMKQHIELVHVAEKNIICTDCGKAFLLPIYLKTHRQVHHNNGLKPFICDFCGKGSFTKRLLNIHIKRHHTVKVEVRCNLCLKGFFTKQDLKRHLRRMHPAGEEDDGLRANLMTNLFHCPFCSRTYQGIKMCQMHIKASHPGLSLKAPTM